MALDHFSVGPFDLTSMDAIAESAGVSKALLYHYFPSKRDLYVEALAEADTDLRERTRPDPRLAPRQQLRTSIDAYLTFVKEHPDHYAAVLRGGIGADEAVWKMVERTRQLAIDRVVRALGLRSPPAGLQVALHGWVGFLEASCLAWIDDPRMNRRALHALLVQSLDATILAAAAVDPAVRRAFVRRWVRLDRLPAFSVEGDG